MGDKAASGQKKPAKKNVHRDAEDDEDSEEADFRANGDDEEDSFDSDFDEPESAGALEEDDKEFDMEAYLKWRQENPDAAEPENDDEEGEDEEYDDEEGEDEGDDDEEDSN